MSNLIRWFASIIILIIAFGTHFALAEAPAEKVTKEESAQAKVIGKLADKVDAMEKSTNNKLNALSSSTDSSFHDLEKRITELERIVSGKDGKGGLQHEITKLHSKKEDKKDKKDK